MCYQCLVIYQLLMIALIHNYPRKGSSLSVLEWHSSWHGRRVFHSFKTEMVCLTMTNILIALSPNMNCNFRLLSLWNCHKLVNLVLFHPYSDIDLKALNDLPGKYYHQMKHQDHVVHQDRIYYMCEDQIKYMGIVALCCWAHIGEFSATRNENCNEARLFQETVVFQT